MRIMSPGCHSGITLHLALADLVGERVKAGGKEKKRFMGEGKPLTPFVNATLPQEDGLAA